MKPIQREVVLRVVSLVGSVYSGQWHLIRLFGN